MLAVKPFPSGDALLGREMAWHVLEAGDTLVVRVRPRHAHIWRNQKTIKAAFYDVVAPASVTSQDSSTAVLKNYIAIPECLAAWLDVGQRSVTMQGAQVNLVPLPEWFPNMAIVIFVGVVAAAMGGVSVAPASFVGIFLLVMCNVMTPHEVTQATEWRVYASVSFAFAIGAGMNASGLAQLIGDAVANLNSKGFTAILFGHVITGLVSCIVGNQGTPQICFPILLKWYRLAGIPDVVAATVVANACVSGFLTQFGLPTSMIVMGPGNYSAKDFVLFGFPVFVVFALSSSVFTCVAYGLF